MKNLYTSYDQLPLAMNAIQVAQALGISKSKAYELMHARGFPSKQVGSRLLISKLRFIEWLDSNTG